MEPEFMGGPYRLRADLPGADNGSERRTRASNLRRPHSD